MPPPRGILIVEDEWLQAESVKEALERRGFSICGSVTTGEQAVKLAASARPDFVIMDVKLRGGIDGVEAATRIVDVVPTCGVIFVTAYNNAGMDERMEKLRPRAIIMKPVKTEQIVAALTSDAPSGAPDATPRAA